MRVPRWLGALLVVCSALVGCASPQDASVPPETSGPSSASSSTPPVALPTYEREPGVATDADVDRTDDSLGTWLATTAVDEVSITSTLDGTQQPALFAPPAERGSPLLVVVHSWSNDYTQEINIPFARWTEQVGWGFLYQDARS